MKVDTRTELKLGSSCLLNPHLAALPRSSAQRPTHSILLPHPLLLKSLMSALLFCLGLYLSLLPCLAPFSPQTPYLFVPSPLFPLGEVWPNSALRSIQGAGTSVNGQGQGICLVYLSAPAKFHLALNLCTKQRWG